MASTKRSKKLNIKKFLGTLLDPQDMEVFVVRGKGCSILFANEKASFRFDDSMGKSPSCRETFAKSIPDLCDNCPYGGVNVKLEYPPCEVKEQAGRTHIVKCHAVNWEDGRPATVFVLRDITAEVETRQHLYTLAYIDHLTKIPNRQKLKEDFTALEDRIISGQAAGVTALFDLDRFKEVNDRYGHNSGDLMLRRLSEHLQDDKAFAGHLYRLGGDEFVLLFADPIGRFADDEEMKKHYQELLSRALRSYTLPNINVSCTISVGVALFPRHGNNFSDILRKADIALYRAKEGGRNQVAFFEDQYEVAQKFKDLFINIQPLLLGSGKTFGYELIDRGNTGEVDEQFVNLSGFNRTVDALGLKDIESDQYYFISFSAQLLNPAIAKLLPKEKFVIQITPGEAFTAEDIKICMELRKKGYKLAINGLHSKAATAETMKIADYFKFAPEDKDFDAQKRLISANSRVRFIAVNVNSGHDFQVAKEHGFKLYQGFYFNEGVVETKTKELSPLKVNYLRLLRLSSTDGPMDFQEISAIISADVTLTYKLLRILNSAAVGLRNVSSIAMAVAYLGEENLKKWISVLALRGIAEDQPVEIFRMSLIRARFGELLALNFRIKFDPKKIFMVGMLSLLHVVLEIPKEQLMKDMPVADDVRESLLTKSGIYAGLLKFYENYEYANWDDVSIFIEEHRLNAQHVNDTYIEAVKWYNDLIRS
ncbi:MAG: diguanylate cyclase [Lachnospiraceae bacterium]|jgi:EAL and modified HD-GYP domain-containing signal transduction protein|nr:diguanylate cyclase [Lachnospiraceae bacterium]